jgi:hypothetical protein
VRVLFQTQSWLLHIDHWTHKTTEPVTVLNSCSRVQFLQLMHCLMLVRQWFQLFCHSMSPGHRKTDRASRHSVTSRCSTVLFGTSLSRYSSKNVSLTAKMTSMLSNVPAKTRVLLVNVSCSQLHCCWQLQFSWVAFQMVLRLLRRPSHFRILCVRPPSVKR